MNTEPLTWAAGYAEAAIWLLLIIGMVAISHLIAGRLPRSWFEDNPPGPDQA